MKSLKYHPPLLYLLSYHNSINNTSGNIPDIVHLSRDYMQLARLARASTSAFPLCARACFQPDRTLFLPSSHDAIYIPTRFSESLNFHLHVLRRLLELEVGRTMDELSYDTFLTVVVPATVGVGVVVATVVLIFWVGGAGKQTSYEDAMKDRQGRAEKALRKQAEKEKEQKQKKEKKRVGEKKRKQEVVKPDSRVEVATPKLPPAQKSILKTSRPNSMTKVSHIHVHARVSYWWDSRQDCCILFVRL